MKTQAYVLSIALTALFVQTARAQSPDETSAGRAAVRFQQAVELYREGSYEGALAEFRKAYQLSPSYRVLYNIAQTQYALHDFVGAYKSIKQYIAEGGNDITADRRTQVDEMSMKLAERIAHLQIITNVAGADIRVDDVSVGKSPLTETLPVNVGTRKVSAVKAGAPEAVRVVTVAGKEILRVDLRVDESLTSATSRAAAPASAHANLVTRTEPPSTPGHTGLIVSVSTTAALAVATGVFGYLALQAQSDYKDQLNKYPNTRSKIEDARTKSKNLGYITDAFGAATLLSGGVAAYFALTYSSAPSAKGAKPNVVGLAPTVGGMLLQGSF